jgi:hypothetical protein
VCGVLLRNLTAVCCQQRDRQVLAVGGVSVPSAAAVAAVVVVVVLVMVTVATQQRLDM